jgi:hypothetical protein
MTEVPLTVSIDRTSLSLSPLVFSATADANPLGLAAYTPPARQARVIYAPDSINIHGSEALGMSWQQALLNFDWFRESTTEAQLQAAYAEVVAAVEQFSYLVTTQVSDAPAEVWRADPGSVTPSQRDYADLANLSPVYSVSIPVYPIPGSA